MSTWYETDRYKGIQTIGVSKNTDKFIWVTSSGRRRAINTDWYKYHPTREAALAHLRDQAHARVERAKEALQRERSILGEVLAMCSANDGEVAK
jgi:hypothetical protein